MSNKMLFFLSGNETLTMALSQSLNITMGQVTLRHFPDGESYVRVDSQVEGCEAIVVCTLDRPDTKMLPLLFLSKTLKQLGASTVSLVAPYLAYMRQDRRFKAGEAVTSEIFGELVSLYFDRLITVDPHLHRRSNLSEIFSIPTSVAHAAEPISKWIKGHVNNPILIGPDSESEQWVSKVAEDLDCPFIILTKIRYGDKDVEVSKPHLEQYHQRTPVFLDDIISTGTTMIEAVEQLKGMGMQAPVCIAVHPVFCENGYENLLNAGVSKIITCNTIQHPTNAVDISGLLAECLIE